MILCRDCKHLKVYDDANTAACHLEQFDYTSQACINIDCMSCHHAERADGLTVCCRDCDYLDSGRNCKMWSWTLIEGTLDENKMSCPEWQPREEKE